MLYGKRREGLHGLYVPAQEGKLWEDIGTIWENHGIGEEGGSRKVREKIVTSRL